MSRFRLRIEYDGTRYHGWQSNPRVKTIQGEIIKACEQLFNTKKIELYGAGRTDAGVHALGQTAHLDVPTQMHPETVVQRLNEILPYDIHILEAVSCKPDFHARFSAVARSYIYLIAKRRSAFGKHYSWWVKDRLDISAMKEVSAVFTGFHDFASFGAGSDEKESTRVDIVHFSVNESDNMILIHITGSHFLWMMVRRLAGVLVHTGKGKLTAGEAGKFLETRSERPAQLAAPPAGLYLEKVYYKGDPLNYAPQVPVRIL